MLYSYLLNYLSKHRILVYRLFVLIRQIIYNVSFNLNEILSYLTVQLKDTPILSILFNLQLNSAELQLINVFWILGHQSCPIGLFLSFMCKNRISLTWYKVDRFIFRDNVGHIRYAPSFSSSYCRIFYKAHRLLLTYLKRTLTVL